MMMDSVAADMHWYRRTEPGDWRVSWL